MLVALRHGDVVALADLVERVTPLTDREKRVRSFVLHLLEDESLNTTGPAPESSGGRTGQGQEVTV